MKEAVQQVETLLGYPKLGWFKSRPTKSYQYRACYNGLWVTVSRELPYKNSPWRWVYSRNKITTCSMPFQTASEAREDVRQHLYWKGF